MPKPKQKNKPISAPRPKIQKASPYEAQIPLGYDPAGAMEPRDVISSKDGWSEYTLQDGTIIRAKAVILDVKRAIGQYSPDGNPLYILQYAFVNQVKAPDELKSGN